MDDEIKTGLKPCWRASTTRVRGRSSKRATRLDEGESAARNAIHQIDERLHVYRLKALK
jgi:hypothetical protein